MRFNMLSCPLPRSLIPILSLVCRILHRFRSLLIDFQWHRALMRQPETSLGAALYHLRAMHI